MSVRAKFRVASKTESANKAFVVHLEPVITGSEENKQFYKWTPSGKIELATVNEDAAKQFEVGTEMYIDFTPATPVT